MRNEHWVILSFLSFLLSPLLEWFSLDSASVCEGISSQEIPSPAVKAGKFGDKPVGIYPPSLMSQPNPWLANSAPASFLHRYILSSSQYLLYWTHFLVKVKQIDVGSISLKTLPKQQKIIQKRLDTLNKSGSFEKNVAKINYKASTCVFENTF